MSDRPLAGKHAVVTGGGRGIGAAAAAELARLGADLTLMGRTLARTLDMEFKRVQFTPDLMPSDITGTDVMEEDQTTGKHRVQFMPGPVFTNFLLADEINRTPPKTQAALLQAMQEREVTAGGTTYPLEDPFFVLATQNPIEQEGTYPLPEAQLDRFMFELSVEYPERGEEIAIVRATTGEPMPVLEPVVSRGDLLAFQDLVRRSGLAFMLDRSGRLRATRLVAETSYWMILVIGFLTGLSIFDTDLTTQITQSFVFLLPKLVVAGLILLAGIWLSQYLVRSTLVWAVNESVPSPRKVAGAVRIVILFVTVVVVADYMDFARSFFLAAFIFLVGGAALPSSLVFGLGGRDSTRRYFEDRKTSN